MIETISALSAWISNNESVFSGIAALLVMAGFVFTAFKIFHYAGGVVYDSEGFVKKNADKLYDNLEDLMKISENSVIKDAFGGNDKKMKRNNSRDRGRGNSKINTAGGNFVKQLKAFRDGTRADPVMAGMAKPLSDADIDIAAPLPGPVSSTSDLNLMPVDFLILNYFYQFGS